MARRKIVRKRRPGAKAGRRKRVMKPGIRLRLKRKRYSKAAGKGVLRVQRRKRSAAVLTKGRGRASGYAQAYNKAFDQAYNEGFSTGFAKGLQDGQQA